MSKPKGTVFILSVTSDIGRNLAERYAADGWQVAGTYRSAEPPADFPSNIETILWDASNSAHDSNLSDYFAQNDIRWDLFISCVGVLTPIGKFFELPFSAWEQSFEVNAAAQLRALHTLWKFRSAAKRPDVILFAGAGTNGPADNYSAYALGKVALIKMAELLAAEQPDLNIAVLGTGWVRTKIHEQTLASGAAAGANLERTVEFLKSDRDQSTMDEIFAMVNWITNQRTEHVSGRNFSIVNDAWREKNGEGLALWLSEDRNRYRLRRSGNDWRGERK